MRRIVLALVLAACAGPAFAVQDRYGPPRAEGPLGARVAPPPAGPMLDWQGKSAAPQPAGLPAAEHRPEPIAPWAQRMAPRPAQDPPQSHPLAPQPAAMTPVPAAPQQARVLPPPANASRPYAPAAIAAAPVPTAQAAGATARPRFYSVSRQYGAQPDPIPAAGPPRGQPLTLNEIPTSENLGRTQAPLDDGRASQAVPTPVTRENAAADRARRLGL